MKKQLLSTILLLSISSQTHARITFGDKNATIKVAGGTLKISSDIDVKGTIVREGSGTISGSGALNFENGVFVDEGANIAMTGSYDPASNEITLAGSQQIVADQGTVLATVKVSGTGNAIKGQPVMSGAIQLLNSSAALSLGIQSEMNKNITLNSGAVTLAEDLVFTEDHFFTGPGTINGNNRKVETGGSALASSTDLTFTDGSTLVLHAPTTITGDWTCEGSVTINGTGNSLSLSTGSITVASGATLKLVDMHISDWAASKIILTDATSKVQLSGVSVLFTSNETYSAGTIEIVGDSTFTLRASVLTFDSSGALVVNGAKLSYETLHYDFATLNESNTTLSNDGVLFDIINSGVAGDTTITASTTLSQHLNIGTSSKLIIDAASAGDVAVDMSGHSLTFSSETGTQLDIKNGADASFEDAYIKNLIPSAVSIDGTSSLVFGDGSSVELAADQTTAFRLDFSGTTTLDGNGKNLTISSTNGIYVAANSTLTIRNITLKGVSGSALACAASTSKIIFENVTLILSDTTTLAAGAVDIVQNVTLKGGNRFVNTSTAALTVKSQTDFTIARDTTYVYDPSNDADNLLLFEDSTAQMILDNSTLEVATTDVVLKVGTIVIDDAATIKGAVILGDGSSSANNFTCKVASAANIDLDVGSIRVLDAS